MMWLVLIAGLVAVKYLPSADLHPDSGLNVIELTKRYGFPIEVYDDIETDDGYLLQLHRIPHGLNNANQTNKPPVFLMHCLLCSSGIWITTGPKKALAFLLADLGYDVWMGNARGNKWSRKHVSLDPDVDKEQFWAFSWHAIGVYDLPASIDYILSKTNQERLFYIGFSQGTTSFFVMTSEKPEYNEKIRLAVALGPGAYMYNVDSAILRMSAEFVDILEVIAEIIGFYEYLPVEVMKWLTRLCRAACDIIAFCNNIISNIFEWSLFNFEEWMLPVILTHVPVGASTKQIVHYIQLIKSERFGQYDYGPVGNMKKYGSTSPPNYDISKIVSPVALFVSEKDKLATVADVDILAPQLPNLVLKKIFPYRHMDFLYANDVSKIVYDPVFDLMALF